MYLKNKKHHSLILDTTWVYQDAKSKATMYNETKYKLLDNCFQEWVQSPDEVNMFDLQGTTAERNSYWGIIFNLYI